MKSKFMWAALAACLLLAFLVLSFEPASAAVLAGHGPHALLGHGWHTYAAEGAAGLAALEKQMGELAGQLKGAVEVVQKNAETAQSEMKNLGKLTAETKESSDKALAEYGKLSEQHKAVEKKIDGIAGRMTEVEQAIASRKSDNGPVAPRSLGAKFVGSDAFKSFIDKGAKGNVRVQMERADITGVPATVGNNTSQGTSLQPAMRVPGIVTPPQRKLYIRDLLAPGTTGQSSVEYVQETGFTNNAAVVTEAATKPKSDLTFELKNAPVRTIAHIFKASRQILDDAAALQSYIDARARYGLALTEETEMLTGDGTGVHLKGLIPSATTFDAAFVPTSQNKMDVIRLAILQVFLANFPASGIVLYPTDWAAIQLTKDSQNRYIIGNPQDGNEPKLWNLPVVESLSMTPNDFLVGAFNLGAQIFDRMEVEVLLSTENSDDFEKNMVTIRAEERVALAVYRPEAFVTGDFTTAT